MAYLGRTVAALVVFLCLPSADAVVRAQPQTINADAKLLMDFQERVKKYVELHKSAAKELPAMKDKEDPAKIKAVQDALAAKIQAARSSARQGEIFTPEISQHLRKLMYPELKGVEGKETKQTIKEDAPAPMRLKVNARYPESQPLPTVPPNILANLPKLPEELEYRIVRNDLILRDVPANLIVDFLPGAIR